MQKTFLFILTLVGLFNLAQLNAGNPNTTTTVKNIQLDVLDGVPGPGGCNLPAPTNFVITGVGTTWISATWNTVNTTIGYHVVAKKPDGTIAFSQTTTASAIMFTPLEPNTTYNLTVCAICPDGNEGSTAGNKVTTLIIDLVIAGFTPTSSSLPLSALANNCFPTNWSTNYTVKIMGPASHGHPQPYAKFLIGKTPGSENRYQVRKDAQGENTLPVSVYTSAEPNASTPSPNNPLETSEAFFKIVSDNNATTVFKKFTVSDHDFCISDYELSLPGYSYAVYEGGLFSFSAPNDDRSEIATTNTNISVSPNPFRDRLTIQMNADSPAITRMFDITGKLIHREVVEHPEGEITFNTEYLQPSLYILQVEQGGKVQTFKVIKE